MTIGPDIEYENSLGPTLVFSVYEPNCARVTFANKTEESLEETLGK